jgi:hypothetical protein
MVPSRDLTPLGERLSDYFEGMAEEHGMQLVISLHGELHARQKRSNRRACCA